MKYILALLCALGLMPLADCGAVEPQPPHPNADFTITVVEGKLPAQVELVYHNQDVVLLFRTRPSGQETKITPTDDVVKEVKDPALDKNVHPPKDGYFYTVHRFRAEKDGKCLLVVTSNGNFVASFTVTVKLGSHHP